MAAATLMFSHSVPPHSYSGHYSYPAYTYPTQFLSSQTGQSINQHANPVRRSRKRAFEDVDIDSEADARRKRHESEIPSFSDSTSTETNTPTDQLDIAMIDDTSMSPSSPVDESLVDDVQSPDSPTDDQPQSLVPIWPIRSMRDHMLSLMHDDHKRQMQKRLAEMKQKNDQSEDESNKQLVLYQPVIPPSFLANMANDNSMADVM